MMLFVCFIWVANFEVPNLFFSNRSRALQEKGSLSAYQAVLIPPSRKMKANITDRIPLTMISDSDADQV